MFGLKHTETVIVSNRRVYPPRGAPWDRSELLVRNPEEAHFTGDVTLFGIRDGQGCSTQLRPGDVVLMREPAGLEGSMEELKSLMGRKVSGRELFHRGFRPYLYEQTRVTAETPFGHTQGVQESLTLASADNDTIAWPGKTWTSSRTILEEIHSDEYGGLIASLRS